ncbi:Hypothetical predicted protein [Cloeon dipterum]|uniref:PSI domain-containing protein n=1 Tax=Cloeon dipterum TaxID=197152 RepID=A0A8S1DUR3_9INSE|nr:Hypothetical predicted protein [Cloeon dipterum]
MDRSQILPVLTAFILLSISCASCQEWGTLRHDEFVRLITPSHAKITNHSHYQSIAFENKVWTESLWDYKKIFDFHSSTFTKVTLPSSLRRMQFDFPFYGELSSRDIFVKFDGYLEFGNDKPYESFNQVIAPFHYQLKLKSKSWDISIRNEGQFIVQYNDMEFYDSDGVSGKISFQVTLYDDGYIAFVYKEVPDLSSFEGRSFTYFVGTWVSEHFLPENKIELKSTNINYKIRNNTLIFLRPVKWCPTYSDCYSCVANKWKLPCKWCAEVQRCSDGFDTDDVMWKTYQCDISAVNSSGQCDTPRNPF